MVIFCTCNLCFKVVNTLYFSNSCISCFTIASILCFTAPGSAPRNVRAKPHSPQTIMINWDEPEIPNGAIQVNLIDKKSIQNSFLWHG